MTVYRCVLLAALASQWGLAAPAVAQAPDQQGDRRPTLGYSIAWGTAGRTTRGPLFQRMEAAVAAANADDGVGFDRFVAPGAELQLTWFEGTSLRRSPFTVQTIRAAAQSCLGLYPFDEGPSWVQLSWVCRVDGQGPLASLLTFRESPELTLTVWFENGLISRIDAMEPLPIPGRSMVAMEAYATARGAQ